MFAGLDWFFLHNPSSGVGRLWSQPTPDASPQPLWPLIGQDVQNTGLSLADAGHPSHLHWCILPSCEEMQQGATPREILNRKIITSCSGICPYVIICSNMYNPIISAKWISEFKADSTLLVCLGAANIGSFIQLCYIPYLIAKHCWEGHHQTGAGQTKQITFCQRMLIIQGQVQNVKK